MSEEMKAAYKKEAQETIKKVSFWITGFYRFVMLVGVAVTTKMVLGVPGVTKDVIGVYSSFKQLEKDSEEDKKNHIILCAGEKRQDSIILNIDTRLLQAQADITCNRNEIVNLKVR